MLGVAEPDFGHVTRTVERRHTPGAAERVPSAARRGGGHPSVVRCYWSTISRSPPSTCCTARTASRATVPALAAVMDASIFIASMVATV